ncbi:hypothetical protein MOQ72_35510 [Saccharopolyspora sp. K220]|uniref:hypothetical protein n=1 Tax=Saccharopolyspora soli TaxID=2926618 RepID=UPI001F595342|nr:hypothetical protein [Saccharopolyspora soli]MCI2422747.1 hypothetical protein [Saccharopolyspora soli]
METEQLGQRVAEYRTDNARRRKVGLVCLLIAVVGLGAGIPMSIAYFTVPWGPSSEDPRYWSGSGILPSGFTMLGALCLCVGIPFLVKAARTRGECFELYERGLVHRVADAVSTIRWSDVESVRLKGAELQGGPHMLGIDFQCALRLTNGRRLKFNTYTADATKLAAKIDAAVNRGFLPKPS